MERDEKSKEIPAPAVWVRDANEMAEGARGGNPGAGLQISYKGLNDASDAETQGPAISRHTPSGLGKGKSSG